MKKLKFSIFQYKRNQGFTLFVAMVVTGTLLLVSAGVISLAVRQSRIANSGKESQLAFYAADTGIECALYWEVQNPAGVSAFATSTGSTINCNKDANNPSNEWVVGGAATSYFLMTFLPDPYCAIIEVSKVEVVGADGTELKTVVTSKGYNTCDEYSPRRVERAIRLSYYEG